MKAKVNFRVEIIEGEDAGYILEETNRLVDFQRDVIWPNEIKPYKLILEFVTPNILREAREAQNDLPV